MRYVLIDTNGWMDLLANESEEKDLRNIEHWVSEKKIELLVPEKLNEEWTRNRNRHLNQVRESVNIGLKSFERTTQKRLKKELKRLEEKAQRISQLFACGKLCAASKRVHAEVGYRKSQRLPPFHINENSDGDAYIYFSAMAYAKSKKLTEVLFISHDKQAFSHPDREAELHPSLIVEGIKVIYFYGLGPGIFNLKHILGIKDERREEPSDYDSIFYLFEDNKRLSLVEKIYNALDAYHDQLPFIPTHLLVKIFPFKVENIQTDYTYWSSFRINTNNTALAEFFQSIEIMEGNKIYFRKPDLVKNLAAPKKKVINILQRLNQNLVFDFSVISSNLNANIRLKNQRQKPNIQDLFNNFDFLSAYRMLRPKPQKNSRATLQQAYIYFQFGYFDQALQLLDHVYEKSKSNGKSLLSFLALYDMKRVKSFILSYYTSSDENTWAVIKKIDHLSIRDYRETYETEPSFVLDCMAWITDSDFYHEAFLKLSESVEKIRDHYYLQLRGGFSSNSNYQNLLSQYLEIDQFLEQNCVIFNTYSNYEEITEKLAEGLLMMLSFNSKQDGSVDVVDYFLAQKLILYSKRETLVKFYHRLHIREVATGETDENRSLIKIAEKFFGDYLKLKDVLNKEEENRLYFFWEKYYKVAGNLLFFLTASKNSSNLTSLTRKLIRVLSDDIISSRLEAVHIADFIREKGKDVQGSVLRKFLLMAIDNGRLHDASIFFALSKQRATHHNEIIITSTSLYKKIEQYFLLECPKCNRIHDPGLLKEVYTLLDESLKRKLHSKVTERLYQNFNADLYYVFAIYGIIDCQLFFEQFLESCPPLLQTEPKYTFFGDSEANYHRLNQVVNLAFKLNIDTKTVLLPRYKGASSYYDWLLDMDGFDYSLFNPEWILAYKTSVYLKKIFSNPTVQKHLANYLKKSKHPVLSELMIQYGLGT